MSGAIEFFDKAIKKKRSRARIVSVVLLLLCVGAALWGLSESRPGRQMTRLVVMSLIGLPMFGGMLIGTLLPHRGLAALRQPFRIVWIYSVIRQGEPLSMVGFDDGKLRSLPVGPPSEVAKGLAHLHAVAPNAARGYSEQLRVAFKTNPRSLLRA